jgi:peroxiredoxin
MKKLTLLSLCFLTTMGFAQNNVKATITGNIFNLDNIDSVRLVQQTTTGFNTFGASKLQKDGTFKMDLNLPNEDYYVLLVNNNPISLIIHSNSSIKVFGDGKQLSQHINIVNSDESVHLNEFLREQRIYQAKFDSATAYLQQNPQLVQSIQQSFTPIYQNFQAYRNDFINTNTENASQIAAIKSLDVEKELDIYGSIVSNLERVFSKSPTVKAVRAEYEKTKEEIQKKNILAIGNVAPDFTQNKLDGKPMKLSDLRGKVVLIDFWASWCGPCRRENPNVVAAYNKYKDKGFTIMSVSLDKDKNAWQGAIEKDGLIWPNHVSDLKQWSNEAARLYQVSAIPFTVLIDKDGKILATNIRGEELYKRLETIFGF